MLARKRSRISYASRRSRDGFSSSANAGLYRAVTERTQDVIGSCADKFEWDVGEGVGLFYDHVGDIVWIDDEVISHFVACCSETNNRGVKITL